MSLRGNDDDAIVGQPLPGELFETGPYRVGQIRGVSHVEPKLDGSLDLLDILAAGAGGPHERLMQLVLVERDPRGNRDQGDGVVSLMIRGGS